MSTISISSFARLASICAILCSLVGCSLPPELFLQRGPAAVYTVTDYTALGDSITEGQSLSSPSVQTYAARIAAQRRWNLFNIGLGGDQACDLFPRQIFPHNVAFATAPGAAYSIMIGTNDATFKGTGSYEPVFTNCHLAALTWLATRPADKLFPGDTSVTPSGNCTSRIGDAAFLCSAAGSLTLNNVVTTGASFYVWYGLADSASSAATFTITVDGTMTASASAVPPVPIATAHGITSSVGILRIPLAAGTHTLGLATPSGGINILAFGTNRALAPIPIAAADVPNQLLSNPLASVATQLAYTAHVRANIALAIADHLDIRPVADREVMLGTAAEMTDQVHPNEFGHLHLAQAFSASLP